MAIPIREDGSPGPTRHLVVFVHGFCSSPATWSDLLARLHEDKRLSEKYEFCTFQYATASNAWNPLERLPTIAEIGAQLGRFLDLKLVLPEPEERTSFSRGSRLNKRAKRDTDAYIDTVLVGHSMGGLVIQSYISQCLEQERGDDLDRIRQVILFATPSFGSPLGMGLRRFLPPIFRNPQERLLRVFDDEIQKVHSHIRDAVLHAQVRGKTHYPLPFFCFWGDTDNIVPRHYAQGHFEEGHPLRGHHNSLHHPETLEDDRYRMFFDALMRPHGHSHVWELDEFVFNVRVAPLPPGTKVKAHIPIKPRVVICDNVGTVTRMAHFSRYNRYRQPFTLKYRTTNEGWLTAKPEGEHITRPDKVQAYEEHGTEVWYDFIPEPGSKAWLEVKVYKGFDEGHRDVHMHLGRNSYYRRVCYELDLTAYVKAGWSVVEPKLYFHPDDKDGHELCNSRKRVSPDPCATAEPQGKWSWVLEHITEGVVDIVWDVKAPGEEHP